MSCPVEKITKKAILVLWEFYHACGFSSSSTRRTHLLLRAGNPFLRHFQGTTQMEQSQMNASRGFGFIMRDDKGSVIAFATKSSKGNIDARVAKAMGIWVEFPFALDCGIRNLIAENDNQIVITAILNQNKPILVDSSHSEISILWCQSGNASIKDRVLAITMDKSALMCLGNGTRDDDEVS